MIPHESIEEALKATDLLEKFRAAGGVKLKNRMDPAYIVTLVPGESVIVPGQRGLDDLGLYVGVKDDGDNAQVREIIAGTNWIVHPLQIQVPPPTGGTDLLGHYFVTKVDRNGKTRPEFANRMAATPGGKTLLPRTALEVGTLNAAATDNAKHAIWGEIDKGIQCGIRPIDPKSTYRVGDTLAAELLWRNVSDAAIVTPLPRRLDIYPVVRDDTGDTRMIDFGARYDIIPITLSVAPGEIRSLGITGVTLVVKGAPSPKDNSEPGHIQLEPGTYKLSGSGGVSATDGPDPKSGEFPFIVIADGARADEADAGALDLP